MAHGKDLLPIFSVTNGPGWDQLCQEIRGVDYSIDPPISFHVVGIRGGIHLGLYTLSTPELSDGMCKITGVWLNAITDDLPVKKVVLDYSPSDRKGRVVSITE